jgi:hypothetical protein
MPVLAALLVSLGSPSPLFAAEGGELPRIVNFAILAWCSSWSEKPAEFLNARLQIREAAGAQARANAEVKKAGRLLASLDQEVRRRETMLAAPPGEKNGFLRPQTEAARIRAERIEAGSKPAPTSLRARDQAFRRPRSQEIADR